MIKIYNEPMYYHGGRLFPAREPEIASGREKTITYHILNAPETGLPENRPPSTPTSQEPHSPIPHTLKHRKKKWKCQTWT